MLGSRTVALALLLGGAILGGCQSTEERAEPSPAARPARVVAPAPARSPAAEGKTVVLVKSPQAEAQLAIRRSVDLDVRDALVTEVLETAARQVGVPFAFEGDCTARVTLSVHAAPFSEVADFLARAGKLQLRVERGVLCATTRATTTLQASGASASTWFRLLAKQSGKSIVLPGHMEGTIDAELHDVDPLAALVVTARANGFEVLDDRGGLVQLGSR